MTEPDWIVLREYASQLDADLDAGVLERNGIPHQVHGAPIGIFGPGFSGATSAGVRILVPADRADEAANLIAADDEP